VLGAEARPDAAKILWHKTFEALGPEIEAGTPVVGIEPACVSAFRDELPGLFPGDGRASQLARSTSFLSGFLDRENADIGRLRAPVRALLQFHCHHHASGLTGSSFLASQVGNYRRRSGADPVPPQTRRDAVYLSGSCAFRHYRAAFF
jgi:Fe-S oxidoreductase